MRVWEVLKIENRGNLYWIEGDEKEELYEVVVSDELWEAALVNIDTGISIDRETILYEILNMNFIKYDEEDVD